MLFREEGSRWLPPGDAVVCGKRFYCAGATGISETLLSTRSSLEPSHDPVALSSDAEPEAGRTNSSVFKGRKPRGTRGPEPPHKHQYSTW